MNLHGIVRRAINTVNPDVKCSIYISTGTATAPSGKRVPSYADPVDVMGQVQPITSDDLKHIDNLNLQRYMKSIHLNGSFEGVNRLKQKGGDRVVIESTGEEWLTVQVLEQWPDWCRIAVRLQVPT